MRTSIHTLSHHSFGDHVAQGWRNLHALAHGEGESMGLAGTFMSHTIEVERNVIHYQHYQPTVVRILTDYDDLYTYRAVIIVG